MGQEATAHIVQPLYFCLKVKFSHMVGDSRKSIMWIHQWPRTSQIHFIYMSIYLCIHINIHACIDRAIVLKERGRSRRAVAISAISGWPPTPTRSLPGAVVTSPSLQILPTFPSLPAVHAACLFFGVNHNSCLENDSACQRPLHMPLNGPGGH